MLRRLALIVALLGPIAALAQTAGQVQITPSAFGTADCASTTQDVALSWTSSVTPVAGGNEIYRVWVSTNTDCPSTGTPNGAKQPPGGDIAATSVSGNYPVSGTTYSSSAFIGNAGAGACDANVTIYVCVQQLSSDRATGRAVMTGSAKLETQPPPIPVSLAVAPGDTALFVSWAAGTKNPDGTVSTVAAASYNVTAVAQGNAIGTHTASTANRSLRLGGLTNGVTYGVSVASVSAGGNVSAATNEVMGTPQPVDDFWDQYTSDGGREPGGCAGGPAGALSLLGVALALRGFRRRS